MDHQELQFMMQVFTDEEMEEYSRLTDLLEQEKQRRFEMSSKEKIEDPEYFYGAEHPEFLNHSGVSHLFLKINTELHHMDESCENLLDIDQIADVKYHVIVKPGIDPINLTKDFLDHLDKSIDTSYVNIEKEKNKQETT